MGFDSRNDCCGQFVKYSLIVSNFLIFVSKTNWFDSRNYINNNYYQLCFGTNDMKKKSNLSAIQHRTRAGPSENKLSLTSKTVLLNNNKVTVTNKSCDAVDK